MKEVVTKSLTHALEGYNSHLAAHNILEGLTLNTASKTLPGSPYTIWQLIGHISFWQERTIAHLKGQPLTRVHNIEEGWPFGKSPSNSNELQDSIHTLLSGVTEVKQLLEKVADLKHPPSYDSCYDLITSMATHLSYHLGQIMILRRMQGDYPPPSGEYPW
ncbi:DinB family protein [Fulvivirga sp. 29W222]|uniref:DinB family protein n=1 Tax=Fulvivirga marina TaxID=2494733 RepID=A0A937KCF2_9BACT|nr:DinB family protein [Fulvivirga marina]MBL6444905.1 DinB family protein [Fulvivirga marina]